jgi:uncharacterized damage-inducible protein DinB
MLTAQQLAEAYARNATIIQRQADGLTHADSVLQLPFRGNCFNWVLGHILEGRNTILGLLGAEPALDPAIASRYAPGSEPILADGPEVAPFSDLLEALERGQGVIAEKLATITAEAFARETPFFSRSLPLDELLFFLYFHDCYHTGQAEPLRQLAGKDDKVI